MTRIRDWVSAVVLAIVVVAGVAPPAAAVDPITFRWLALGGANGFLGAPTAPQVAVPGGSQQTFVRGRISWSIPTGPWETYGAIGNRWVASGGVSGALGFPIGPEVPTSAGTYQSFQRGRVTWSPTYGTWETYGAVNGGWVATGGVTGPAGVPIGPEIDFPGGARGQAFVRAFVIWHPTTGVRVSSGWANGSWRTCTASFAGFQREVPASQATVTVVDGNGGSSATMSFFVRTASACDWQRVFVDPQARIGSAGLTDGATRIEGSRTTPLGSYTITETFGLQPNPGTQVTYHHAGPDDYWVGDKASAYYNDYRNRALGGFALASSERLVNYPTQYQYALVINFNRAPDVRVPGRGSAIFVHLPGTGATLGCVSTPAANVLAMLRSIRAGDVISIIP
ncbi:MAG: L,D-transpeptidase family protein [Candidatus Phosphoribacter sp.]